MSCQGTCGESTSTFAHTYDLIGVRPKAHFQSLLSTPNVKFACGLASRLVDNQLSMALGPEWTTIMLGQCLGRTVAGSTSVLIAGDLRRNFSLTVTPIEFPNIGEPVVGHQKLKPLHAMLCNQLG